MGLVAICDEHSLPNCLRAPEQVQQDLEYFYDYWVKMYLRRATIAQSLLLQATRPFP